MLDRLELGPLAVGAAVGFSGLMTAAVVARVTQAGETDAPSWVVGPLLLLGLLSLTAAGRLAARRSWRAPLTHAAVAAVAATAAVEIVVVSRQLVADDDVAYAPAVAWLLLGLAAGVAGGLSALRLGRRADSAG